MKKVLQYLIALFILLFIGFFVSNYLVSNKIKSLLAKENSFSYSELGVNSFTGNLKLKQVNFIDSSKQFTAEELNINVSIFYYLLRKELKIEHIDVEKLDLNLTNSQYSKQPESLKLDTLQIKKINLTDAHISYLEKGESIFEVSNLNISAEDFTWPLTKKLDWLNNDKLAIEAENIQFDLNNLHYLKSEKITFNQQTASITNFSIQPKYSTTNYVNYVDTEKDLMDLKTKSVTIFGLNLYKKDSLFQVFSKKIEIDSSDFNIYRDKTIANDLSFKPLYSQSLRELDFLLTVDSLLVSDLDLAYQELLVKNRQPAEIKFNSIQAEVSNLHNDIDSEKPEIDVQARAKFSKDSKINFSYELFPDNDQFCVSTQLKSVKGESVNSFFGSAMSMELDGSIDNITTALKANNSEMNGNFSIAYEKLKVNILKKDGAKNPFASLMSNALIRNKDVDDTLELKKIKRNPTKSFWNYIWTFHLQGLKKTLL